MNKQPSTESPDPRLAIAVKALRYYANRDDWDCEGPCVPGINCKHVKMLFTPGDTENGFKVASEALTEIGEI